MENNIKEYGSFDSRVVALNEAYKNGDSRTVRFLIDNFKAKRAYYSSITVEDLTKKLEQIEEALYSSNLSDEQRAQYNNELAELRQTIVEKKAFIKNAELVDDICNEKLNGSLQEESSRIKRNRVFKVLGAVLLTGALAVGIAKCHNSKKDNSDNTNATTIQTIVLENGDETISTGDEFEDYYYEETNPIEYIEDGYVIDPVIGTGNYTNNGGSYTGTNGTTNGNTSSTGTVTPTPGSVPNIPGVNPTNVIINYDPSGQIQSITWPDPEPTGTVPSYDPTPTGTDRLPVEPSIIVDPIPTDTTPSEIVITPTPNPNPEPTPVVPGGEVPEASESVAPTAPSVPVPTNVPEPTAPTAPTDPTIPLPTPIIPIWDFEGQNVTTYDDGKTASRNNKVVLNSFVTEDGQIVDFTVEANVAKTTLGLRR